ncbi:RagB/SusD family nutrient uptake outer membrane protein [Flavobacterium rhizosphaerae]|uniref:RagB/SusD family nutrient uptake outer membrane protein n=1 Tax=Flavobacterium rhizosphaerae TaxID=3163298 RepID=A0ABW8YTU7_9FLAO
MKKNIIKAIVAFSLLGLYTTSCTDDFVDIQTPYTLDSETYFNSEEDYQKALIGVYDILQSTYVNVLLGEIASDNTLCGGESATDTPGFQQIDNMTHTPVNPNLKNVWDWMFAGVNRANYIMEYQDKTDFEGKQYIIAQTRFLRAYFHFELVKWFGGIPLKGDQRFVVGDETSIPRASKEEVYASIEADLQYAVENMYTGDQQAGRITLGAAKALLGKVYLYQNKFSQAAAILEEVIQSGDYSLESDYNIIFENEGENGSGSVFEVQYTDQEGAGFECLQCSEGNVAVGFNGPRNYVGPLYDSGYSFNVPTQEAYDAYEPGDIRRDVAILNIEAWAAANPGVEYGIGYEHTGYFNKKYIPRQGDLNLGDNKLTNPNNYRAIRYADVLLMAAEAYNETGNDEKARQYVNMVRARAFGDNNHNFTSSGAALGDQIWAERRRELMGEGHRFFDLVRTGRAASAIEGFTTGKNELFPIPYEEIQFSNGNWEQNPGY